MSDNFSKGKKLNVINLHDSTFWQTPRLVDVESSCKAKIFQTMLLKVLQVPGKTLRVQEDGGR